MIQEDIRKLMDELWTKRRRKYSEMLRQLNLHIGQDQLLCQLWKEDGVTQLQLSERLNCEPPTVANMVKAMENRRLIYRRRDPIDARVNRVYLTPAGKQLKKPVEEVWQKGQDQLLEGMSSDELSMLKKLLEKMTENING